MKTGILNADQKPWKEIKEIYMEAFPKAERKPFSAIRRSVNKGKALLLTAMENEVLQGFVMAIPYKNMVMVDYLAVSSKIRSRGTGNPTGDMPVLFRQENRFADRAAGRHRRKQRPADCPQTVLFQKRFYLIRYLYHRAQRKYGGFKLWRYSVCAGIHGFAAVCVGEADVPAVRNQADTMRKGYFL